MATTLFELEDLVVMVDLWCCSEVLCCVLSKE